MNGTYKMRFINLFSLFFVFSPLSHAKVFKNDYLEFQISDVWSCQRQTIDWICRPQGEYSPQALIIVTAKQTGPEDNLQNYLSYLSKPKPLAQRGQNQLTSEVVHAKQREIAGHPWVESLHLNSEVENFYTLYLATVKRGLSILVSLSVEKPIATKFNKDFASVVKSLKIVANEEFLARLDDSASTDGGPVGISDDYIDDNSQRAPQTKARSSFLGFNTNLLLLFVIGIALIGGIFYYQRSSRKTRKKRR